MDDGICVGVGFFFVLIIGAFVGGCATGRSYTRDRAIEARVAEWTINAKTGDAEFRFLSPPIPSEPGYTE